MRTSNNQLRQSKIGLMLLLAFSTAFAVQPLEITDVIVDELSTTVEFTITGQNFMNGGDVKLWLGGIPLVTLTQTDTVISARLPDGISSIIAGSYQLLAMTGNGTVRQDAFDGVTIGAQGLQGIQGLPGIDGMDGATGSAGPQGATGDTGATGPVGADGATGVTGSTGPQGEQGPAGLMGLRGLQGTQGLQGEQGSPGPQGPEGLSGGLVNEVCNLYQLAGFPAPQSLISESPEATCDDNLDNDCDGLVDDPDPDCEPPPQPGVSPGPGDLVITEIMVNSLYFTDPVGEYFDVVNVTSNFLELQGLTVKDDGTDFFQIQTSLVVEPGGFAVFARTDDLFVDFVYSGFDLSNVGDVIEIFNGEVSIDRVEYHSDWPFELGTSMGLFGVENHDALVNDSPNVWCTSSRPMVSRPDFGSPGLVGC